MKSAYECNQYRLPKNVSQEFTGRAVRNPNQGQAREKGDQHGNDLRDRSEFEGPVHGMQEIGFPSDPIFRIVLKRKFRAAHGEWLADARET